MGVSKARSGQGVLGGEVGSGGKTTGVEWRGFPGQQVENFYT